MSFSKKNEHRCSCGRLLFKGYIGEGCVEIKCKRCGIIACFDGAISKKSESIGEKPSKSDLITVILILIINYLMLPMATYAAMYSPGETLDPSCLPTDANCSVESPVFVSSGVASAPAFSATSTAATSTFAGYLNVTGLIDLATTTASGLTLSQNGLTLSSSTPVSTSITLYNNANSLYWSGNEIVTKNTMYNYTTGWLTGGQISINAGDNTKIDITAGSALIADYSDPVNPDVHIISWSNQTSVDPGLSTRSEWVGVQDDGSGNAQFVFNSQFTSVNRRSVAVLGRIWDSGGTGPTITNIGDYKHPAWGLTTAFQDFVIEYGSWNISGNVFSANGTNLLLDRSAGTSFRYHTSSVVGSENVHTDPAETAISSYQYHIQGNSTTTNRSTLDPAYRDDGSGGLVAVSKHSYTRQEVYFFPVSHTVHILYGQSEYSSIADAVTASPESINDTNRNILDGAIHRATLIMREDVTDISGAIAIDRARIVTIADVNGGVASGGNVWSAGASGSIYYIQGVVGIGTTTPDDMLAVQTIDSITNLFEAYSASGTTRFIITDAGNVGIGTSSPVDTLQVVGDVRVGTGTTGCVKDADGTVIAGVCSSDQRLKTNITNAMSVLDKLKGLRFVTYNWNEIAAEKYSYGTEATQYGLIADEVEKLFPELIHTDDKGYKTLDYSTLSLYGLNGIHELAGIADQSASMVDADGRQTFVGRFFSRLVNWLADKANGITRLFAKEIYADKLCLADGDETICLTAADIKSLGKRTSIVVPNDSVADMTFRGGEVDIFDVEVSDFDDIASTTEETEVSETTGGEEGLAYDSQTIVSNVSEDAIAAEDNQDISEEENPEPEPSVVTEPPIEENSEGTDVSTIAEDELSQ